PQRTLAIMPTVGDVVSLKIGGIAKIEERDETITMPPAGPPGMPPQTRTIKVPEEYRYAKLGDGPTVFVVKATALQDVFAKLDAVRDSRLARFNTEDVQEVTVAAKGQPPVKLTRKKGDLKATADADKFDRWFLDAQPAPVL